MKRHLSLFLALILLVSMLAGCNKQSSDSNTEFGIEEYLEEVFEVNQNLPMIELPQDNFEQNVDRQAVTDQDIMNEIYKLIIFKNYHSAFYTAVMDDAVATGIEFEIPEAVNAVFDSINFFPDEYTWITKNRYDFPNDLTIDNETNVDFSYYIVEIKYISYSISSANETMGVAEGDICVDADSFITIMVTKEDYEALIKSYNIEFSSLEGYPLLVNESTSNLNGIKYFTDGVNFPELNINDSMSKLSQEAKNALFTMLYNSYNFHTTTDLASYIGQ